MFTMDKMCMLSRKFCGEKIDDFVPTACDASKFVCSFEWSKNP